MPDNPFKLNGKVTLSDMLKPMQEQLRQMQEPLNYMNYIPQPNYDLQAIAKSVNAQIQSLSPAQVIPDEYFEKTLEYQKRSLDFLQSINENTANLYSLVELINKNEENQDQIIYLLTQIMNLAKADSKEKADSGVKKIMQTITEATSDAETLIKLTGWATAIYQAVSTIVPNIPV